jgi:hypothetical protein
VHQQGKQIKTKPIHLALVGAIGIFGAFALATAFVTGISSIYFILTGQLYPGQVNEDLKKMLGYCLVGLVISGLFGIVELWQTVQKFLPARQPRHRNN